MIREITTEKIPIKLWLDDIEDTALQQAKDIANMPFSIGHVAIMPDSHQGYGMPIGGVLAMVKCIVPNAVGVDIGCGMCSLRTSLTHIDQEQLKKVMGIVRKTVPVGFNHHNEPQPESWMPDINGDLKIVEQEYDSARKQVGTLGGGNHFIEIQKGSDGYIWIMVHSGSRNIGYKVAEYYNNLAIKLAPQCFTEMKDDLAYFPEDIIHFQEYYQEMEYCIEFALNNRRLMMERVKEALTEVCGDTGFDMFINKPHNFADREQHFGHDVIVHRKGATRARKGELGMIPGSQGSPSYIVIGKGNPDSLESCSHGAGRGMSRNRARKILDLAHEKDQLEGMGVIHAVRNRKDLDEAPSSYKDIRKVMANQKDLIDIHTELTPLAVIKG